MNVGLLAKLAVASKPPELVDQRVGPEIWHAVGGASGQHRQTQVSILEGDAIGHGETRAEPHHDYPSYRGTIS